MTAVDALGREIGVVAACRALSMNRAQVYRRVRAPHRPQPSRHLAMTKTKLSRSFTGR